MVGKPTQGYNKALPAVLVEHPAMVSDGGFVALQDCEGIWMLTVVCVKVGNRYGPEYVEKLNNAAGQYLPLDEFVCVADDPKADGDIIISPISGLPGWWQKMGLFQDPPWGEESLRGHRLLYLDLDVVITGSLDDLVNYPTEFAMHLDFQKPWKCASAVMVLDAGSRTWIWDHFNAHRAEIMKQCHGDQDYLGLLQQTACIYRPQIKPKPHCDFLPQRWVRSYKMHAKEGPPEDCRVVAFHGKPDPADIQEGWVKERW